MEIISLYSNIKITTQDITENCHLILRRKIFKPIMFGCNLFTYYRMVCAYAVTCCGVALMFHTKMAVRNFLKYVS